MSRCCQECGGYPVKQRKFSTDWLVQIICVQISENRKFHAELEYDERRS